MEGSAEFSVGARGWVTWKDSREKIGGSRRVQRGKERIFAAEFSAEMKGSSRRIQRGRIGKSSPTEISAKR